MVLSVGERLEVAVLVVSFLRGDEVGGIGDTVALNIGETFDGFNGENRLHWGQKTRYERQNRSEGR
jgi:hypothetical protein